MKHHRLLCILILLVFGLTSFIPSVAVKPVAAQTDSAPWLDAQLKNGIIYLLYQSPSQIRRYQISTKSWLADIGLPCQPSAFLVDGSNLFVACNKDLYRLGLDGQTPTRFYTAPDQDNSSYPAKITNIAQRDPYLFLGISTSYVEANVLRSINKNDGQQIDYAYGSFSGLSINSTYKALFARQQGVSPAQIVHIWFDDNGALGGWETCGNSYNYCPNGNYPYASKTWVVPGDWVVADNGGTVYIAMNLSYAGTMEGGITDLTFVDTVPIALRNGVLLAYSDKWIETGQFTPVNKPFRILADKQTVYALSSGGKTPVVETIPLSAIKPPVAGEPIDPLGLVYTPDDLLMGQDGVLFLMSTANKSIFRWSVPERRYLETIPLAREPKYMAYSAENNRLFVAYASHQITRIDLDQSTAEIPMVTLPGLPCEMLAFENFLFTCENSWRHSTYTQTGQKLSEQTTSTNKGEYAWDPNRRKIYYAQNGWFRSDYLWFDIDTNGIITGFNTKNIYPEDLETPIRLAPDGSKLMFGTGQIVNPDTWEKITTLPVTLRVIDGAWRNETLFTVLVDYNTSPWSTKKLQKWNADFSIPINKDLSDNILRIFSVTDGLLAVTSANGKPSFLIFNENLELMYTPPVADFNAEPTSGYAPLQVQFTNHSTSSEGSAFLWNFGDGQTSTEINPVHIYQRAGNFDVSLTIDGANGQDRLIRQDIVQVRERLYLPVIHNDYLKLYPYPDVCQMFHLPISSAYIRMTECVPSIGLTSARNIQVNFNWKADILNNPSGECLNKYSDYGNPNMYLTDQQGNHYEMISAGGAANYISCMESGTTYLGWFLFPPSKVSNPVFTFHDDDNQVLLGPLSAPD